MSTTESAIKIVDVGTIGVPVADQDRALAFYRDALGFEVGMDAPFGEGLRRVEVAPPGATTSVALRDPDGNRLYVVERPMEG